MKIQHQMINSTLSWKRINQASHVATFTSPIGGIHNIRLDMYRCDPIPQTVQPSLLKNINVSIKKQEQIINSTLSWEKINISHI